MLHEMREDLATSGGASTARRWVVQTRRRQSRNSFNLPHPCHSMLSMSVIVMFPLLSCHLRLSRFLVLAPFRHHLCLRDLSHAMLILCTMLAIYDCLRRNRVFPFTFDFDAVPRCRSASPLSSSKRIKLLHDQLSCPVSIQLSSPKLESDLASPCMSPLPDRCQGFLTGG